MTRQGHGFFIIVLTLLVTVAPAAATTSRVLALGGDGAYLEDNSGVLRWYGSLTDYPDLVVIELSDVVKSGDAPGSLYRLPGHGGGAHFRLDDAGSWGTVALYAEDDLPGAEPGGAFTALWSRAFGRVQAGLYGRFTTYGQALVATGAGDQGSSQYFHHYGLGLRVDLGEPFYVDVAGELVNSRAESMDAVHHMPPTDDWSSYGLRARGFLRLSDAAVLVPLVDHFTDSRAVYAEVLAGPADRDACLTSLGLGLNLTPDTDNLVMISAEYRSGREDHWLRSDDTLEGLWDASERSFAQIRGRVGVESSVLPWLTLRAAFQYIRGHEEISRYTGEDHENLDVENVVTPLSLGLGLRFGSFDADLIYNDTAPINPGLLAEGLSADERDGFTSFSVLFRF